MQVKEKIWVFLLAAIPLFFGCIWSIYQTDPHHWGFIIGTAVDVIHGKRPFTETYIQYGIGEPYLFKLLNYFLPFTYTTAGFVTAFTYSLTLVFIYLGVKKLSNFTVAVLISATALLLHTYAIYPWPDYYAGFFLAAGCYCLISAKETKHLWSVLAGLSFFIAFLFRSTYLLSIFIALIGYGAFALYNKSIRNRGILIAGIVFITLSSSFLIALHLHGDLNHWYLQAIGSASSQYGIASDSILRLIKNALLPARFYLPNMLAPTTYSVLFYLGLLSIFLFGFRTKNQNTIVSAPGLAVFFALLGGAGLIQCLLGYEVFRLQNACLPLFFTVALLIHHIKPNYKIEYKLKVANLFLAVYFILMIVKIPHASSYFPLWEGDLGTYKKSTIPIFGEHRFDPVQKEFYETLSKLICVGNKKVLNLTDESAISSLCEDHASVLALPFFNKTMLNVITPEKLNKIVSGNFELNEIIVSDVLPAVSGNIKLVKIGEASSSSSTRYIGKVTFSAYQVEPIRTQP